MATIRQWLIEAAFKWEVGTIVLQDNYRPPRSGKYISLHDPLLDKPFDNTIIADTPRFLAMDHTRVYFVNQSERCCYLDWLERMHVVYIGRNPEPLPYPDFLEKLEKEDDEQKTE